MQTLRRMNTTYEPQNHARLPRLRAFPCGNTKAVVHHVHVVRQFARRPTCARDKYHLI